MGRIGRLVKTEIATFIKIIVETRAKYNQPAFMYAPSGDDSPPVEGDRIILVKVDGTGKYKAVGVLAVSQGAKPGEKIFFARDPDGEIVSKVSMLNSGDISAEMDGNLSVAALNTEIKSNIKLTGGTLETKGMVTPDGNGPYQAMKVCPLSGAVLCGSKVSGT